NATLLEQAIVNLLDNAIKYSHVDSEIRVSAKQNDQDILIDVRDQGMGIEKQHLSRLFERFYRVDKARSRKLGGTGLGLAIVKHIVQVHRGRVAVDSVPGHGSTFSIHLPSPRQ
ncbi:MAG: ATP-binding protein, partial [Deltaproteobacteria bacterium]|nr:ATP-binding protein [Deltaproteobacteria bacterium]